MHHRRLVAQFLSLAFFSQTSADCSQARIAAEKMTKKADKNAD
jgi:hypothetical protein